MSYNITIRKVTPAEADALLNLSRQTFFDAFAAVNAAADMQAYADVAFTQHKLESELNQDGSDFYFAMQGDEILGYLKINSGHSQTEFQHHHTLEVERIYVLKQHQGKQIGEQLLNFAIGVAQQNHCEYIWLGVWEQNHNAIRFYQRSGFTVFGSHDFTLGSDRQTDVLMKKELT